MNFIQHRDPGDEGPGHDAIALPRIIAFVRRMIAEGEMGSLLYADDARILCDHIKRLRVAGDTLADALEEYTLEAPSLAAWRAAVDGRP